MNRKQRSDAEKTSPSPVLSCLRDALTALLIFSLPLLYYIHNSDMSYPKSVLSLVGVSLLVVLWAAQWLLEGKAWIRLPALFWPGVGLLAAAAASLVQAPSLGTGVQSLAMLAYFFLLYCLVANQTVTAQQVKLHLGAALCAVLAIGVYALLQHFVLVPSGITVGDVIVSLGNRVAVGQYVNSLIVACTVLVFVGHRFRPVRVLWGLAVLLGFLTLALTKTSGPLISLTLVALLLMVALLWLRKRLEPAVRVRLWLLGLAVILLISGGLVANKSLIDAFVPRVVQTQITPAARVAGISLLDPALAWLKAAWEANSGDLRSFYWWVGLEMWKAHPLLGVGLGQFKVLYVDYAALVRNTPEGSALYQQILDKYEDAPTLNPSRAHNDYVQAVAEMGGVGLLAILIVLIAAASQLVKHVQRARGHRCLALLLIYAGTVVFLIDALVNFPGHLPASSLNFVVLLGIAHSRYFCPTDKLVRLKRLGGSGLALMLIVVGAGVSVFAVRDWQANLHLERGIELLLDGKLALAEQQFQQSLALDFAPAAVYYHMGTLNLALGRTALAKQFFERSLQSRVYEDTLWKLANLSFREQDIQSARRYLDRFLATFVNQDQFLEARYLDALIELRLGHVERAIQIAEQTLGQHPEFEELFLVLADAALAQKDYAQAFDHYERAKAYLERKIGELEALGLPPNSQAAEDLARLKLQRDEVLNILSQLQKAL